MKSGVKFPLHVSTLALATVLLLTACGGTAPHPAADASKAQESATTTLGDATVRANVQPTLWLDAGVARSYGIQRAEGSAMLLVNLRRKGTTTADESTRARIEATASDLSGRSQRIEMREIRTGQAIDYVGTVAVQPPDTMRFEVRVERDGARATLNFDREFFPR